MLKRWLNIYAFYFGAEILIFNHLKSNDTYSGRTKTANL